MSKDNSQTILQIKKGIWLYIILLIFEGAIRKWLIPSLSDYFLLVRDPVAVWLLYKFYAANFKFSNVDLKVITVVSIVSFIATLVFGHGNLQVAAYGLRINILHFPIIFLIGKIMDLSDIVRIGKFFLYLSLPMTILIVVQFYSPQSSFVNIGVGGNIEGAGFGGSGDYFRPPGTFSFTSGNVNFYSLLAPFVFYFLFFNKTLSKLIVYSAIICLIVAIPFSISRTLFFSVIITLCFLLLALRKNSKQIGTILSGVVALIILNTSLDAFTTRFTEANENEGGFKGVFIDRFLGGLIGGIISAYNGNTPFWGSGLGLGTNVGAKLFSGKIVFLVDEVELGRIIGEMGLLLGLSFVLMRLRLSIKLLKAASRNLVDNNPLPWLLLSYSFLEIFQGQTNNPNNLGFVIIAGGFCIAALNTRLAI